MLEEIKAKLRRLGYEWKETLGKGSVATVELFQHTETQMYVAAKYEHSQLFDYDQLSNTRATREYIILRKLYPNLNAFLVTVKVEELPQADLPVLCMPYFPGKSFAHYLIELIPLRGNTKQDFFALLARLSLRDIGDALSFEDMRSRAPQPKPDTIQKLETIFNTQDASTLKRMLRLLHEVKFLQLNFVHIVLAIARALRKIHKKNIVHGDISLANAILIKRPGNAPEAFWVDFTTSTVNGSLISPDPARSRYCAPELRSTNSTPIPAASNQDIYSLAFLLRELLKDLKLADEFPEILSWIKLVLLADQPKARANLDELIGVCEERLFKKYPRLLEARNGMKRDLSEFKSKLGKVPANEKLIIFYLYRRFVANLETHVHLFSEQYLENVEQLLFSAALHDLLHPELRKYYVSPSKAKLAEILGTNPVEWREVQQNSLLFQQGTQVLSKLFLPTPVNSPKQAASPGSFSDSKQEDQAGSSSFAERLALLNQ